MNLQAKIESILFAASRPVKINELVKALQVNEEQIKQAISELISEHLESGVTLIEQNGKYQLVTAAANSKIVTDFLNAEVREHLTDAAIETLAIITYKQPITRAEIEAIRGVNSQYILRQLSIRGLIEKTTSADDSRRNVFNTSLEFLKHIGITERNQLPDFEEMAKAVSLQEEEIKDPKKPQLNENKDDEESGDKDEKKDE